MLDVVRQSLTHQFDAALCMVNDCVEKCPDAHWGGNVAKYPFWQVAYHTLCFVDFYLATDGDTFQFRPDLHPDGWSELKDEHPSRRFEKDELRRYVIICRDRARETIAAETAESLAGPSGIKFRKCSRLELHIYNLRHIQHHTGQLSAFLRRVDPSIDPEWFSHSWKQTPADGQP